MGFVKLENPPRNPKALDLPLREFEGYWQVRLNTLEPYGMNSRNEYEESRKLIKLGIIKSRSYLNKNWSVLIITHLALYIGSKSSFNKSFHPLNLLEWNYDTGGPHKGALGWLGGGASGGFPMRGH